VRVSSIPRAQIDNIKRWLDEVADLTYTEGTGNMNWKAIMEDFVRQADFWDSKDEEGACRPSCRRLLSLGDACSPPALAIQILRHCRSFALRCARLCVRFAGEDKPSGWDFLRDEAAAEEDEESEEESAYSESESEADEEEDEDLSDDDVVSEDDSEEDYGASRGRRGGRKLACVLRCRGVVDCLSERVSVPVCSRALPCNAVSDRSAPVPPQSHVRPALVTALALQRRKTSQRARTGRSWRRKRSATTANASARKTRRTPRHAPSTTRARRRRGANESSRPPSLALLSPASLCRCSSLRLRPANRYHSSMAASVRSMRGSLGNSEPFSRLAPRGAPDCLDLIMRGYESSSRSALVDRWACLRVANTGIHCRIQAHRSVYVFV
jgi:hypothetical protein